MRRTIPQGRVGKKLKKVSNKPLEVTILADARIAPQLIRSTDKMWLRRKSTKKEKVCRIPEILAEIATILEQDGFNSHAEILLHLRDLYLSDNPEDNDSFKKEIMENKYYWLGMGTIADLTLSDREKNNRFVDSYYRLAVECRNQGYRSIYSDDVESIFGGWLKK